MAQQFIELDAKRAQQQLPGFGITLLTALLPVLLMLVGSWADPIVSAKSTANNVVKEYFGMTVPQTFKTWTVCETIISLTALVFTLGVSAVVC